MKHDKRVPIFFNEFTDDIYYEKLDQLDKSREVLSVMPSGIATTDYHNFISEDDLFDGDELITNGYAYAGKYRIILEIHDCDFMKEAGEFSMSYTIPLGWDFN